MLRIIWTMGRTGAVYDDSGDDNYTRFNLERTRTRAIRQLQALGYHVTLDNAS